MICCIDMCAKLTPIENILGLFKTFKLKKDRKFWRIESTAWSRNHDLLTDIYLYLPTASLFLLPLILSSLRRISYPICVGVGGLRGRSDWWCSSVNNFSRSSPYWPLSGFLSWWILVGLLQKPWQSPPRETSRGCSRWADQEEKLQWLGGSLQSEGGGCLPDPVTLTQKRVNREKKVKIDLGIHPVRAVPSVELQPVLAEWSRFGVPSSREKAGATANTFKTSSGTLEILYVWVRFRAPKLDPVTKQKSKIMFCFRKIIFLRFFVDAMQLLHFFGCQRNKCHTMNIILYTDIYIYIFLKSCLVSGIQIWRLLSVEIFPLFVYLTVLNECFICFICIIYFFQKTLRIIWRVRRSSLFGIFVCFPSWIGLTRFLGGINSDGSDSVRI